MAIRDRLPAGPITARQLLQVSPSGNRVVLCEMKGSDLLAVLSTSIEDWGTAGLEVSGLELVWQQRGSSARLATALFGGKPIDPSGSYRVATNDSLTGGQDYGERSRWGEVIATGLEVYQVTVDAFRRSKAMESPFPDLSEERIRQIGAPGERLFSFIGLLALVGISWLLSLNRKCVRSRPIVWGLGLQLIIGVLVLKTAPGRAIFEGLKGIFVKIIEFADVGNALVFGPLADSTLVGGVFGAENAMILAIQIPATIILVSSLTAILYHIGLMQRVVWSMAKVMHWTMKTSGAESLAAAANVFVGSTEAPLLIRPHLANLTSSEVLSMMCGGMATIAGGVFAIYVSFGIDAGHLLAASVMSAPAALVIAKILLPETEHPATAADVPLEIRRTDSNLLDAACRGASEGVKLSINVMGMLIAFFALLTLLNFVLNESYLWIVERLRGDFAVLPAELKIETILGWLFAPIAWLIGIPWTEAKTVGSLIGVKTVATEFIAYLQLAPLRGELSPRTFTIATYCLCGFANFASVAVLIGGISALEEGIRPKLAKLGLLAMVGGILAAMMTGAVAGILL